jgi:hypothetical protein
MQILGQRIADVIPCFKQFVSSGSPDGSWTSGPQESGANQPRDFTMTVVHNVCAAWRMIAGASYSLKKGLEIASSAGMPRHAPLTSAVGSSLDRPQPLSPYISLICQKMINISAEITVIYLSSCIPSRSLRKGASPIGRDHAE